MSVSGWAFTNPAALWFSLLALVVIAIHILKPRRTRQVVASILHWRSVASPVTSTSPWKRLQPSWLLGLQVLAALLLALLLAGPVRLTDEPLADHTIFIIDTSSSMGSTESSSTNSGDGEDQSSEGDNRLDLAVERARELRGRVPTGGEVTVIEAGAQARAVLTRSRDRGSFDSALDGLMVTEGTADFGDAFTLAAGLNTGQGSTGVVFLSDGGVPADQLLTAPAGTRFEPVGSRETNRGISQLTVEQSSEGLVARVSIRSFSGSRAVDTLRLTVDGNEIGQQEVVLDSKEIVNLSIEVPAGEQIVASLESDPEVADAYRLDNQFYATVTRRQEISVLKVGESNPFLETALGVIPGLTLQTQPSFVDGEPLDPGIDVVIADRVAIPADLDAPIWAIVPPNGFAGVETSVDIEQPPLTLIRNTSSLVAGLDLSEVRFARAQKVTVPTQAEVVLGAEGAPLLTIVRPPDAGTVIYQSFAVDETNLPLLLAFPVMTERILTDLAQASTPPPKLPVGAQLPIDPRLPATVVDPFGKQSNINQAGAAPRANTTGFWSISQPDRVETTVAINPRVEESAIKPVDDLVLSKPNEPGSEAETLAQGQIPLRRPFLAVLLLVLAGEWWIARRKIGIGRRQWQAAQSLRAIIALALIVSFLGLTLNRPSDQLTTLFLVDGSDSITSNVSGEAPAFISKALTEKEKNQQAGIVAFGRNARLENVVSEDPQFTGLQVEIDSSGTDIAGALRLGAAALPADSRNRMVLLSDGRSTVGDIEAEGQRLAEAGIPVDVVLLESAEAADVAVAGVRVPSLAQAGERVSIEAEIIAPTALTSEVTLRRGTELVEERNVELEPGSNKVVFEDVVGDSGVVRYQVLVDGGASEAVTVNNSGFAAVRVAGEQRVLVIEGSLDGIDRSENFVAAMKASGLPTDVVTPEEIPVFESLTQYSSVVLVNVSRGILTDGQVENLTRLTRDLGRGLVVIGGPRTYGPGGYLNTDLEKLLPVMSDITDPLRRQSVAVVLAVDISGSMSFDGRVDKLGLARAGLVRAVDNLAPTDEIGVITMDGTDRWALELQANPSDEDIEKALARMQPAGGTFLGTGLLTAADAIENSDAALKHIIMFSDGFTAPGELARLENQAAELNAKGYTVSMMATGDGTPIQMERAAAAGGGRYHSGTNIQEVPDIIVQEVEQAARSFINEGNFVPTVTSSAKPVRSLQESPPLLGYVATTPKPTSRVDLRIGPDGDPLMASWRVGAGRATVWTSDGGTRWAAPWNGWSQTPDFWAGVVKETFPTSTGDGAVETVMDGDQMIIRVDAADDWPDDAQAVARVSRPDGEGSKITLERIDGSTFGAVVPVDESGIYAVGATVEVSGAAQWSGIGLSTRSYPAEYAPRPNDPESLNRLATLTGGRVDVAAIDSFDMTNTREGTRRYDLAKWLLWFSLFAWPLAVVLSRWTWRRGLLAVGPQRALETVRELRERLPKIDRPDRSKQNELSDKPSENVFISEATQQRITFGRTTERATQGPAERQTGNQSTGTKLRADKAPTGPPLKPPSTNQDSRSGEAGQTLDQLLASKRKRKN